MGRHSRSVGDLAAEFAEPFGGAAFTRLAGLVHDAGKATDEVQRRFLELDSSSAQRHERLGIPHKREGAIIAASLLRLQNQAAAAFMYLALFGHHSGIPSLRDAVRRADIELAYAQPNALSALRDLMASALRVDFDGLASECVLPQHVQEGLAQSDLTRLELFGRLCHSAIVDADFLDTSAHFAGVTTPWQAPRHGMQRLWDTFLATYRQRFMNAPGTPVNQVRREVFDACTRMAEEPRRAGIYRLPAPTGTGKTLAAAAFALSHAARFGKSRVIVAVPFTTITTQSAQEYREMFPGLEGVVLEHHSNIIDETLADETWYRLSAPQWDSEFVVTTTVQLLESLFSNRPSRTRKLHRIVNSVIVLDEVQALPVHLLAPILAMLRELTEHYGVTVLLASATQPSFWEIPVWEGLPTHDILPVDAVPAVTQRVTYEVRRGTAEWSQIADELATHQQALAIVNTRGDADRLFTLVQERLASADDAYLLSRSMTSDHRARVLVDVRDRLGRGLGVHLVSTQLIEAGVDVDFPVVYRALAPADSVVQAAGRCNRNGRLPARGGLVVVVDPREGGLPPGPYRAQTNMTRSMFADRGERFQFDDPASLDAYYRETYWRAPEIQDNRILFATLRGSGDYPRTADEFRMISDDGQVEAVVTEHPDPVTAAEVRRVVDSLSVNPLTPLTTRERRILSRHTASVPRADADRLAETLPQGVRVWCGDYDRRRGAITTGGLIW